MDVDSRMLLAHLDSAAFDVPDSRPPSPSGQTTSPSAPTFHPRTTEVIDLTSCRSGSPISICSDTRDGPGSPPDVGNRADMHGMANWPQDRPLNDSLSADMYDVPDSPPDVGNRAEIYRWPNSPQDSLNADMYDVPDSSLNSQRAANGTPPEQAVLGPPYTNLLPFLPVVTSHAIVLQQIVADLVAERSRLSQSMQSVRSQIAQMEDQLLALRALEVIRRAMDEAARNPNN